MHGSTLDPALVSRPPTDRATWAVPVLLILAAFAIRGWQFGTPLIHVDEDFYLFVGDRMLHGALPYIDIWDRKPIGLFLLYAAIRLLGGGGIVEYQIVATLFAGATAAVVARIAARYTTPFATFAAGLLYLGLLGLNDGMGGQSPVFYNLPVAVAVLLALRSLTDDIGPARIRRSGLGAMALCGVAMQIKYNALFEGVFVGLAFLLASRRAGRSVPGMAIDAVLWIAVAVMPTVLAFAWYAMHGDAAAFVYANFLSIGARGGEGSAIILKRLGHTGAIFALPLLCVVLSAWVRPLTPGRLADAGYRFVLAWLGAALAGYLVFGTYFNHYALALAGPTAAAAAPVFGVRRRYAGAILTVSLLVLVTWRYVHAERSNLRNHGGAAGLRAAVAAIRPRLAGGGCLWVYRGDALLYYQTGSCLLSRYAFPGHLWSARESGAIGIDPLAEIRRILELRPPVIVDERLRYPDDVNAPADAIVHAALARDYRLVAATGAPRTATRIYARN